MSDLPRRRLLAVSGTALAGAFAGCSSSDDDDGNGDDGDDSEPEETDHEADVGGTVLGDVTIDNNTGTSRTVDVIVEFDGEIESWVTETVDADASRIIEQEWPSDPGEFRVTARVDGDELRELTPADRNDPDCLNLFVRIDGDGTLSFPTTTDDGACGEGEADPDEE